MNMLYILFNEMFTEHFYIIKGDTLGLYPTYIVPTLITRVIQFLIQVYLP